MPFTPRLPFEILQSLLARTISSGPITDVSEGNVIMSILGPVAEEFSFGERRFQEFIEGHLLNAVGPDLDARIGQFPPGFRKRFGPSPSYGGSPTLVRRDASAEQVILANALIARRSDEPALGYVNSEDITFSIGVFEMPVGSSAIQLRCTTPGRAGDCPAGAIDTLDTMSPSGVDLISIVSTAPMSNGSDGESDAALRARASKWLMSLCLCTPEAIESLCDAFEASDGTRFKAHTRVWVHPTIPGYVEIVVNDGSSMASFRRPAVPQTGVVPTLVTAGQRYQFWMDWPVAVSPGLPVSIKFSYGGVDEFITLPTDDYLVREESGIIIYSGTAVTAPTPGWTWETYGHEVYIGAMRELQIYINEIARIAGIRLRLVASEGQVVDLGANVTVADGYDIAIVFAQVKQAIISFVADLPPGASLIMFKLKAHLNRIAGLADIIFDQGNRAAGGYRHKLYTTASNITLR